LLHQSLTAPQRFPGSGAKHPVLAPSAGSTWSLDFSHGALRTLWPPFSAPKSHFSRETETDLTRDWFEWLPDKMFSKSKGRERKQSCAEANLQSDFFEYWYRSIEFYTALQCRPGTENRWRRAVCRFAATQDVGRVRSVADMSWQVGPGQLVENDPPRHFATICLWQCREIYSITSSARRARGRISVERD
jgi:hypothetical protein